MVEFYQSKKRRGIAGLSGRNTRVVEPKPYWPGLEIDEHDTEKFNHGSNNVVVNGKINAIETNVESVAKEDSQKNNKRNISIGRVESCTVNSNASPSTNLSRKSNANRFVGDLSTFRSRKRKWKASVNNNDASNNSLPQQPENNGMTLEEQEGGSNTSNIHIETASTEDGVTNKSAKSIDTKVNTPTIELAKVSTNNRATAKATTATKNSTPISVGKTNHRKNNTDDPSSASSSDTRSAGATPRALVKFLLHKKFPLLDEVVSNIREVLFGMVSRSPALLQKHSARAATNSSPSLYDKTDDDRKSSNGNGNGYSNKHNHGGIDHNDALQSGRKQPPEEQTISKFQDICKRQEMLLDRIAGMELTAAKREEQFCERTQELKQIQLQQKGQRQCQEEDFTPKLQRDYERLEEANASLKTKFERMNNSIETYRLELQGRDETIEELEESKRSIQSMFQSRFDEQFRVIEKQRKLLTAERAEKEKLHNRIALLEKKRRVRSAEAEANRSFLGVDTVANSSTAFFVETPVSTLCSKEHHAYGHQIRHRQNHGEEHNPLRRLRSINGPSLRASARTPSKGGMEVLGTSSAYNPRIRRIARATEN